MKCPICGEENTLEICVLTQNARHYKILKNGKKSKKCLLYKDMYLDNGVLLFCKNQCPLYNIGWDIIDGKLVFD